MYAVSIISRNLSALVKNKNVWCMANFQTTELQANIDWCCSDSGGFRDCTTIQRGRICYEPNALRDQASFVVNLYYQNLGATKAQCDFSGTGTQSHAHYVTRKLLAHVVVFAIL
ncbi:hypothetical protein HID58_022941 [Brassica napus]|uniref:X8 domain-containing protein n=1 Tax=Brassica napus TaxID=3708 RepID=A0ABQ8D110_BRANA|nr:hypothetical protein HID58_022941 [Brassica napus]